MDRNPHPWRLWAVGFLIGVTFGLTIGGALGSFGTGVALAVLLSVPFAYALGEAFHRRRP